MESRDHRTPVLQHTEAAFSTDGPLAHLLAGYAENKLQIEYARLVADAVGAPAPQPDQSGEITLIEAGTGVGKSLGYLVPLVLNAALTGERALISTHTNHLADQLLTVDGPLAVAAVERITGHRVSIAVRRGRRNFIDLERVADLLAAMREASAESDAIRQLQALLDARPITFAEAVEEYGLELPSGIAPEDLCLTAASSTASEVAYTSHVAASEAAGILITNHALTLIDAARWTRLLNVDGRIRLALFDEADTLPQVARSMAEAKLPLSTLEALIHALPRGDARAKLRSALMDLSTRLETALIGGTIIVEPSRHQDWIEKLAALEEAVRTAPCEDRDVADGLAEAAADLREWLEAARGDQHTVAVIVPSPVRSRPALVTVAINPARILSRLWSRGRNGREPFTRAVIFTSATLSAPARTHDFSSFMRETGINPAWTNYASRRSQPIEDAPRFGTLSFVLADRDAPPPRINVDGQALSNPAYLDYLATGIAAARERGGRVLILTTSYGDAKALGDRVQGGLVHTRGQKLRSLIETYKADPAAVLITPAAWAGVSLPGMVDHLVIARIPFGAPDEARDAVAVRAMTARGRTEAEAKAILAAQAKADAKRRLRQGLGRAIRRADDKAVVWILDPRFPLPEAAVRDRRRRLHQGMAVGKSDLVLCIPRRFRTGIRPAFDRAEIHRWQMPPAVCGLGPLAEPPLAGIMEA
jgi:ATP-dependent DNA helicase DinG